MAQTLLQVCKWRHDSDSCPIYYRPQRSCGKVIFSQVSVSHSVHSGGGRCGMGACTAGGCVAGGACMAGGYEIWSMSGRYASYWNAFLFTSQMLLDCRKRQLLLSILMTAEERNIPVQYVSHKQLSQMSQIHNVSTKLNIESLELTHVEWN